MAVERFGALSLRAITVVLQTANRRSRGPMMAAILGKLVRWTFGSPTVSELLPAPTAARKCKMGSLLFAEGCGIELEPERRCKDG